MSGELGPEARGILDGGRDGDDPTPGDRARVRASLMQAIAVGAGAAVGLGAAGKASASIAPKAAAGAAAAAKTVTTFGVAKIIGVVAVVVAVGGSGVAISRSVGSSATRTVTSQPAEQPVDRPADVVGGPVTAPVAPAMNEAAPRGADAPEAERVAAPSDRGRDVEDSRAPSPQPAATISRAANAAPRGGAAPSTPAPSAAETDPLAVETRQIREASQAIQAGDARRALAILDAPAPGSDGQMSEERSATRVLALCRAGRVDEAKAAASRFVSEHPRSPFVDRMRHPCADGPGDR